MKFIRFLDRHLEEYILVILTVLMVAVLFMQVAMRNLLTYTFPWSEELARYLFIWIVFIGVSYAVKKNKHIRIDSLEMAFKKNGKVIMGTISNLFFLAFAILVVYFGINTVFSINRVTPGLGISYGWVYGSTLVGFGLTIIRLIQAQWKLMKNRNNDEEVGI